MVLSSVALIAIPTYYCYGRPWYKAHPLENSRDLLRKDMFRLNALYLVISNDRLGMIDFLAISPLIHLSSSYDGCLDSGGIA